MVVTPGMLNVSFADLELLSNEDPKVQRFQVSVLIWKGLINVNIKNKFVPMPN